MIEGWVETAITVGSIGGMSGGYFNFRNKLTYFSGYGTFCKVRLIDIPRQAEIIASKIGLIQWLK